MSLLRKSVRARRHARRSLLALSIVLIGLCFPALATAQGRHFALLVQGASGETQYATLHRGWLDSLTALLRDRFAYPQDRIVILAETPVGAEGRSTAEGLQKALQTLSSSLTPADQLVVVLIGHGSGDGADAKFNLVGRDLSVAEWAALLKPIRARLAVIDTTSASFPFLAGLAAPDRVVMTATSAFSQRYHTAFPAGLIEAFRAPDADLDKNGRVSLLEAFTYASRVVKQQYEQKGIMATEVAVLDDNGDGKGRDAATEGPDGAVAALTYLDTEVLQTSSDPETQRLLTRKQELETQVQDLLRRRSSMAEDEYAPAFQKLMTELATVSRAVREKTGQ